jgi:hypothetical protein
MNIKKEHTVPVLRVCFFLLTALVMASFLACPVEPEDEPGIGITVPLNGNEATYFSLSTGDRVTDPALIQSETWDIAFVSHDAGVFVLTNSGVTAAELGSGGKGKIWYTEQTGFASVTLEDAVTNPPGEYEPYTQDVTRYAMIMGANPVTETMNVMTYLGYREDGKKDEAVYGKYGETTTNPFLAEQMGSGGMTASYSPYRFGKKAFYTMGGGMPPKCTPTNRVYVIHHGDGLTRSKIQFPEVYLEYNDAAPEDAFYFLRLVHEKLEG